MAKVVVTGGAGFIGSRLVGALLARGDDVHSIDSFAAGKRADRLHEKATYHEVDIRDIAKISPILVGAAQVFHCAALPRVQDTIDRPIETFSANAEGTIALLDAAAKAHVARFVFSSSAAVYGDESTMPLQEDMRVQPMSPYALHKLIGEEACKLSSRIYGLSTVSLRYFNVYGPGFDPEGPYGLVVGKFVTQRKNNQPLSITGDGSHTRDYVHVDDVVRANLLAAESDKVGKGEVINIGTGTETSVNEIAAIIGGPTNSIAARVEPARACADSARARALLGWEPTIALKEGIDSLKTELGI